MFRFLMALFAGIVLRLLRMTWRLQIVGAAPHGARILVCWHGDLALLSALPASWLRGRGETEGALTMLVSRSADGDLAARLARGLGLAVVRGSSHGGAISGALGLLRRLREGGRVALTADGSRGPRHELVARIDRLAQVSGATVAVVSGAASRAWRLRTWDRLAIPKPFAKIVLVWAEARPADEGVDAILRCASERAQRDALPSRGGASDALPMGADGDGGASDALP
ncbi:MAG: DUF374 domain-containing protein, partial [Deltaproteobacteria bacterium]|nr:DUF374 domain-containing protein [Deltaproteobacteria bacterium]